MPEAIILRFDGLGQGDYEAVNRELGIDMASGEGDWPEGMLMHAGGTADGGGLVVTEVWASREAQAAFMEARLGAALAAAGVTAQPTVTWASLIAYRSLES